MPSNLTMMDLIQHRNKTVKMYESSPPLLEPSCKIKAPEIVEKCMNQRRTLIVDNLRLTDEVLNEILAYGLISRAEIIALREMDSEEVQIALLLDVMLEKIETVEHFFNFISAIELERTDIAENLRVTYKLLL